MTEDDVSIGDELVIDITADGDVPAEHPTKTLVFVSTFDTSSRGEGGVASFGHLSDLRCPECPPTHQSGASNSQKSLILIKQKRQVPWPWKCAYCATSNNDRTESFSPTTSYLS